MIDENFGLVFFKENLQVFFNTEIMIVLSYLLFQ